MDGSHHNSQRHIAGKEGMPADMSLDLPLELRSLSQDLNALAREDASLANSAMLDRIANASWTSPASLKPTLKFEGEPVTIVCPRVATHSNHAMRLAAAVAILATGVAAFFAVRSAPTNTQHKLLANNTTTSPTDAATAQIESDLALLDDIWGTSDGSTSDMTSDLWASASEIQTNVATDALEELFTNEESMQ